MTREQFIRGYLLLTAQPWGKTYRTTAVYLDGEPSPAEIQLEFYYQKLEGYHAEAWQQACDIHATGEHWPSVDVLKLTMRQFIPKQTALPAQTVSAEHPVSMQEALAEKPELLARLKRVMS